MIEPKITSGLRLALAILGVVAVAGVVAGGLFAAGVFPGESGAVPRAAASVLLAPETASQLVSPQGDVTVDLQSGSVTEAVQLLYQTLAPDMAPQLPPGFAAGSKAFDLSVGQPPGKKQELHLRS